MVEVEQIVNNFFKNEVIIFAGNYFFFDLTCKLKSAFWSSRAADSEKT